MNLTPDEKKVGKRNFNEAINNTRSDFLNRREFITASALAAAVPSVSLGTFYFGYSKVNDPVRVGVIGTGDEGGVLISNISPEYLDVVAICDIRPYNQWRAFNGDQTSAGTLKARQGLNNVYGYQSEDEARKHVKVYERYQDLIDNPDVEAIIIALPLFLHHEVAVAAMRAGKHVLTEKLMAHNIGQCKEMARVSEETNLLLATGHQRHYSVLYDNAVHTIRQGILGKIHHIRAQWHRSNWPGNDSWTPDLPDVVKKDLVKKREEIAKAKGARQVQLEQQAFLMERKIEDLVLEQANLEEYGYKGGTAGEYTYSPLEELIRWRLWNRTGGGLMAELGSHQLDAASIFIAAMRDDGKKVHPLTVTGVGGRHIFPEDRDSSDHVYCMYEFPAPEYDHSKRPGKPYIPTLDPKVRVEPGYDKDSHPEKKVVVTYSSINGNGYGGYGEVVMGTEGTLVLAGEKEALLYQGASTSTAMKVSKEGKVDSYETSAPDVQTNALGGAPPSRGYREEMEHFAWCIRNRDPENQPRCNPEVALADAILALTSNIAMDLGQKIEFQPEWFDINSPRTPEGDLLEGNKSV